jgi:hypothetical protein
MGSRRRIRKERSMLPGVPHRRKTNRGRRTQLVSRTRTRNSKAFLRHYGKRAGRHQSV